MSRSYHQTHPWWRNNQNRKMFKYKTYKLKPYGMHWLSGYAGEFYKHRTELLFNVTTKQKDRKNNKINIYNDIDEI